MSNGATGGQAPQTVPGSSQPVTLSPQQYQLEQQPQQPDPQQQAPQVPEDVQAELTELRQLRERLGPMQNILQQMDGETLHQHYSRYAEMLRAQQNAPEQPRQRSASREDDDDPWGDRLKNTDSPYTDPEINALRNEMRGMLTQLQQSFESHRSNTGLDKVRALRDQFLDSDFPGLASEARDKIAQQMDQALSQYASTPEGRGFLANPQYESVRALGLRYVDRDTMREYFQQQMQDQARQRSARATDAYQPTRRDDVPDTEKLSFTDTWELSGTPEILAEFGRD